MLHRIETDRATIQRWMQEKQALETELAWQLLEIFNRPPLITGLRDITRRAVEEMEGLRSGGIGPGFRAWKTAWDKEKGIYNVTKDLGGWTGIVANVDKLLAQHCGELIRLYGEVVEAGKKLGMSEYERLDAQRLSGQKDDVKPFHWNKGEGGGRQREHGAKRELVKGETVLADSKAPNAVKHQRYAQTQGYVWDFLQSMGGGIKVWNLKDSSTIYKIDKSFGLVAAADISGTTTDCIFFINRFNQSQLDPLFHLLPAATIVAGAHHSLLEVASALALNDVCDYSIGLYSTLFPKHSRVVNDQGAEALKRALKMAEDDPRNRLMLIYYTSGSSPAGCYLWDRRNNWSVRQYAKFARTGMDMLDTFRGFNHWPSEGNIKALMAKGDGWWAKA